MPDIVLEHVSFEYPGGFLAVEDVSLTIKQGEKVAILGQNGAGKTTTVKLMNNLHKPTKGVVMVGDMDTRNYTTAYVSRTVGYVFQNPDEQIFNPTIYEEVSFGPKSSLKLPPDQVASRTEAALKATELWDHKDRNPFDLPLSIRKFVTIASVLAIDNEVLIYDEPTAGQDLRGTRLLEKLADEQHKAGKTVITITHDIEFAARNFQRIIVMSNKHVIGDGSPEEIFTNKALLKEAMLKAPASTRIAEAVGVGHPIIHNEDLIKEVVENAQ